MHAGIPPSLARRSPWLGRHPTPTKQIPTGKADPRPWQGRPPCAVHAGRYAQQAGCMHPAGMQSCS